MAASSRLFSTLPAAERPAAAAAIQHWIPRIVAIDPKELRKKLKLAALESGA